MTKIAIHSPDAPAAIGPYSQAIRAGHTVYLSGQIGLDPRLRQPGRRRRGAGAAGLCQPARGGAGGRRQPRRHRQAVDPDGRPRRLRHRSTRSWPAHFKQPYPARATYQVAALPKGALIEIEATLVLPGVAVDPQTGRPGNLRPDQGAIGATRRARWPGRRRLRRSKRQASPPSRRAAGSPTSWRSSASPATRTWCCTCRCATRITRGSSRWRRCSRSLPCRPKA